MTSPSSSCAEAQVCFNVALKYANKRKGNYYMLLLQNLPSQDCARDERERQLAAKVKDCMENKKNSCGPLIQAYAKLCCSSKEVTDVARKVIERMDQM